MATIVQYHTTGHRQHCGLPVVLFTKALKRIWHGPWPSPLEVHGGVKLGQKMQHFQSSLYLDQYSQCFRRAKLMYSMWRDLGQSDSGDNPK